MLSFITVIRKSEQKTTAWSGGTTTELALHPPGSAYIKRNFSWRLSSATVEAAESTFTPLPGIRRTLLLLSGEMELEHAGQHTVRLLPFEQDSFQGDWQTTSRGVASDFNLMLGGTADGNLTVLSVTSNAAISAIVAAHRQYPLTTTGFYCVDGSVGISANHTDTWLLTAGDLLLVRLPAGAPETVLQFKTKQPLLHLIRAELWHT